MREESRKLLGLLESAVRKSAPNGKFGLLFSGGVDSLLLAVLFKRMKFDFTCFFGFVGGIGEPKDLAFARRAAKRFGLRLETASVPIGEVPALLEKIVPLTGGSPVDAGVALPLFIACEKAGKSGVSAVFSGQGADELFCGYARFMRLKDPAVESLAALGKLLDKDLRWNAAIAASKGLQLKLPFLDAEVMRFGLSLPTELKISGERNKVILREAALALGVPKEFAERKKTAAQYGSKSDRAIEKLANNQGKSKSEYLAGFLAKKKRKIAALFSGGKDSCLALWLMQQQGFEVSCLVSVIPENSDSFMYHKPDLKVLKLQSKALGIPLLVEKTIGEKEIELAALEKALLNAKKKFFVEGVSCGALYSNYQRERVQKICDAVGLTLFSPLWHMPQDEELWLLQKSGFVFVITKIAAAGLGEKWLGRQAGEKEVFELLAIAEKCGFNPAGEGGEYESLVLDAPNFGKRLQIAAAGKIMRNECAGELRIKNAVLEGK